MRVIYYEKIVEYIENVSNLKWKEIVKNSEHSYFFHTPEWAKIIEQTYGLQIATRLYEINGLEILIPMMKRKKCGFYSYSSMPMGYGGIFSASDIPPVILKKILKSVIGRRSLLFRLSLPPFSGLLIQEDPYIRRVDSEWNYTHVLPLEEGFENIWKNRFRRDLKRGIIKAERNNIEIINKNELKFFKKFYYLYENKAKEWGYKKPPIPLKLFENLYNFGYPHVKLRLAVKDDKPIAGLITFEYGKGIFRWMNASLKAYLKYYPNDLLDKEAIEYACEKGYKYYDFGASGSLEGVRKFKERFGSERVEIKRYIVLSRFGKLISRFLK